MNEINKTLDQRHDNYGDYDEQCRISQELKSVMNSSPNWDNLENYQKEALEMIAMKVSRILNGSPLFIDSWRDISGYATLVTRSLCSTEGAIDVRTVKTVSRDGQFVEL